MCNIVITFSDYPKPKSACVLSVGDYRIRFRVQVQDEIQEGILPIRNVTSWKVGKQSENQPHLILHMNQVCMQTRFTIATILTL